LKMPKGRNKGFQYYMCKKFFHPSNPQNLERVFIAKQRIEQKEKQEEEKHAEYEKEQERWNSKNILSRAEEKDKMQLSFMYEPPVGMRKEDKDAEVSSSGKDKKEDFKFEWQRKAPRESYAKDDPNITDHPFGIQVQFTKCMRCQVWGHSHTERSCPKFGKAKDHEEPIHPVDQKKLFSDLETQGMKFTSYGAWDTGKMGKHYDLVYSSNEESDDILVDMVSKMRKKKRKSRKGRSSESDSEQTYSIKKRRKKEERYKESVLSKVDSILAPKKQPKLGKRALDKIDDILFSDITNSEHSNKKSFLSEVDKILDLGNKSEVEDEDTSSDNDTSDLDIESSTDETDQDDDDLTESEMRLLNLVNVNKIDMKHNFPAVYPDTLCHFCREEEASTHLTVCPVYDKIMRGTEFTDIKSEETKVVKRALGNILTALKQRSHALAVTSVGSISRQNMRLLTMEDQGDTKRSLERNRKVEEILELS